MKRTILLSMLTIGLMSLSAQTTPPPTNPEVAPCTGENTKPLDYGTKSIMFNQSGINLVKYDWSNPSLNCHINNTIKFEKNRRSSKTLATTLIIVGISLLPLAAIMPSNNGTSGTQTTFLVMGGLSTAIGIPVGIGAGSSKKKRDYHLGQVVDYYQKKGW